jgi:hypothetical protein
VRRVAWCAALLLACSSAAGAATPTPQPSLPERINVEQLQPRSIAPKVKLHVELIVEINKLGQVTRVRSIKPSHDQAFDAHAYGNALQAFIRTPDDTVILGSYRLTYDYDPVTLRVHRDVELVHRGGVNPNAQGAALALLAIARRSAHKVPMYHSPAPTATINPRRLPDLPQVMSSPSH